MRLLLALLPLAVGLQAKGEDPDLVNARKTLIPDLISALREPAYYTDSIATPDNMWIGHSLREIGKPAIPALIKALDTDNLNVQSEVVDVLRILKAKEAVPALKSAYLRGTNERQRHTLLRTIAMLGGKDAFPFVLQTLEADNAESVISMLGDTEDPRAIPTLEKYLLLGNPNDKQNLDRTAAFALAQIGKPALAILESAFRSNSKTLRVNAGEAIGFADDPAFIPLMIEVLECPEARFGEINPSTLRHKAIERHLIAMLKCNDLPRQLVAARAMKYSLSLTDKNEYSQILRNALQSVPGENRKARRELLIRLVDFEAWVKYEKPAPAIRATIDWMLGPGGYPPNEIAPILDEYADSVQPNDIELMLRLAQTKNPKPDSDCGFFFSEETAPPTEDSAARCIGSLGLPALEKLRELWKAGKVTTDTYATAILFTRDAAAFPLIEEAAASEDENLLEYGLRALRDYGSNPKTESILLAHVKSQVDDIEAAARESLVDIGHKDTIRSIAKEARLPYYFSEAFDTLDEPFLRELFSTSAIPTKALVAKELVNRRAPGSIELFAKLAAECKPRQNDVPEALEYLRADEGLFRKCLNVKSTHVRAIAYLRLVRLMKGDNEAYPFRFGRESDSN